LADLVVTKTGRGLDVLVQHCAHDDRSQCSVAEPISHVQFKVIATKVSRMSMRRLFTMAATLRAMPFTPAKVFDDYTTYRTTADRLHRMVKRLDYGTLTIDESAAGADRIVELFERAITAHRTDPKL